MGKEDPADSLNIQPTESTIWTEAAPVAGHNDISRVYTDQHFWGYDSTLVCAMGSTYTEEELADIRHSWVGALVKFAGHARISNGLSISSTIPDVTMVGAVISLELNYKDSWLAQILWSNGSMSAENTNDLIIVQGAPVVKA